MKYFNKKIVCGILAFIMISSTLCTSAAAVTYSSAYLDAYSAAVVPDSNGFLTINVHVTGCGYMPEIGAEKIFLYESSDGKNFHQVIVYDSTAYPHMMSSGTFFYKDLFRYKGTVGRYYFASVYVYAGKDGGGDTRNYTTHSVMATA